MRVKTCAEILDKSSGRSYSTEITLPRLIDGLTPANFALGLMHKDVRLATQLGIDSGSPMFIANVVRETYQAALNELGSGADVNGLIRCFERQADTKVVAD